MKRSRRAILSTLRVLSLLLALVVAGSWVRSYWRCDAIRIASGDSRTTGGVDTVKGSMVWSLFHTDLPQPNLNARWGIVYVSSVATDANKLPHAFLGFGWYRRVGAPPWNEDSTEVSIPHALLLVLFAVLPAIRWYRRLRRRRLALSGRCPTCGYDLRATPGRCPECGAVPAGEGMKT